MVYICSVCAKVCKSQKGLLSHFRQKPSCAPGLETYSHKSPAGNGNCNEGDMSIEFEDDKIAGVDNEAEDCFPPFADQDEEMVAESEHNDSSIPSGIIFQTALTGVDNHTVMQFVLLQLLSRIRAPRYAYKEMTQWCQLADAQGFDFSRLQSRKVAMRRLEEMFAMTSLRPITKLATVRILKSDGITQDTLDGMPQEKVAAANHPPIEGAADSDSLVDDRSDDSSVSSIESLEESPFIDEGHPLITTRTLKVVCTPLRDSLIHMLRYRPALFDPDNLVVNKEPGTAYQKYVPPSGRLGEVLTGSWYSNAWDQMVGNDESKFLCPLILFMDETITEFMGRYGLEPLVFTLAIFKEHVRRRAMAWGIMGMVPHIRRYKSKQQSARERSLIKGIHTDNLHRVLDVMLQELVNIQQEGGMEMEVCFTGDNVYVKKTIIFSVAFVMGDCKGNDSLAGRFASHTKGVRRISRACNCRSQDSDQTNFQCEFVTMDEVQGAVLANDLDALKEMSQHNVRNAFHKVCFGGDKYNIHGCTPLDIVVHVNQLGIFKYTMTVFLSSSKPQLLVHLITMSSGSTVCPDRGLLRASPGRTMVAESQTSLDSQHLNTVVAFL
jgi:Plavaka transposase